MNLFVSHRHASAQVEALLHGRRARPARAEAQDGGRYVRGGAAENPLPAGDWRAEGTAPAGPPGDSEPGEDHQSAAEDAQGQRDRLALGNPSGVIQDVQSGR